MPLAALAGGVLVGCGGLSGGPAAPTPQPCLSVSRPGYLPRVGRTAVELWPQPPEYVAALVYGQDYGQSSRPLRPTKRWPDGVMLRVVDEVGLEPELQAAMGDFEAALGRPIFSGGEGAVEVRVHLVPGLGPTCLMRGAWEEGTYHMVSAAVECGSREVGRLTVAHELGHALGLDHSPVEGDLMGPTPQPGQRVTRLSAAERVALRMLYLRQPGNRYPDTEVGCPN